MAITQRSWNGDTKESRDIPNSASRENEPNRGPHFYISHPSIEAIKINAGLASPIGSLMVVADGKQRFFSLTRKQIFEIATEAFSALQRMEPGK